MAASSSSQEEYEYDVFLCFRGEDTRRGFTGNLYDALCKKNIQTFMDDEDAEIGYEIAPQLTKAIMGSKIWIIVLSKGFASSTWCLNEVVQILECNRNRNGEIKGNVIPIFYGIQPTIVRKQEESYAVAFGKHANRFKDKFEMVQQWRDALNEVSGVTGHDSENFRYDHELIDKIVNDVLLKLPEDQLTIGHFKNNLIGIEERVNDIESLLCINSKDVRIIGIWGMGGIGKTTLASTVFDIYKSSFNAHCILKNIREETERHGREHLRKKLLSGLLNDESVLKNDTPSVMSTFIQKRFGRKKVIVLLDDLDEISSLQYFLEGHEQFAAGSRIIVTTRDVQLLRPVTDKIYEVMGLGIFTALKLFHKHAFGRQISLAADYEALSRRAVNYANGNPLALMVLGSSLHSKSKKEWESVLDKQKIDPHKEILKVLKISYDRLSKGTQNMFLDIACFTIGEVDRKSVENMFSCSDHYDATIEISSLIDKSLITESIWSSGTTLLSMHDLLREMGRTIVYDESKIPGNRSRLWTAKDVCHVLEKDKGSDTIQGISLNLFDIKKNVRVSPTTFSNMCLLRYLKIFEVDGYDMGSWFRYRLHAPCKYNIDAPEGLFDISDELRYFRWDSCPLKYLPNFSPENLVELIMPESRLEKLWNEVQLLDLEKLKKIDLRNSDHLTEIPNLSGAINLEIIDLRGCKNLVQVHLNFQNLPKLQILDLSDCDNLEECRDSENIATNNNNSTAAILEEVPSSSSSVVSVTLNFSNCKRLRRIPESIGKLKYLKWLDVDECPNLEKFPEISSDGMEFLHELLLEGTKIEELPKSIENIKKLEGLSLKGSKRLQSLPKSIGKLKYLKWLDVDECPNLEKFPEISSDGMECLHELSLEGTNIEELPESIENIKKLEGLSLRGCKRLKSLPQGIGKLKYLRHLNLIECPNLEKFPEISSDGMEFLHELSLEGTKIEELPESIENIRNLERLSLKGCKRLQSLPKSIGKLKYLRQLDVDECPNLEKFPEISSDGMKFLHELLLEGTKIEELPESIENIKKLEGLSLKGSKRLQSLPKSIGKLKYLNWLDLVECSSLEELPRLPLGLVSLNINCCKSLKSIQQLSPRLVSLEANGCSSLKTISTIICCESTHIHYREYNFMFWMFENCPDLDHNTGHDVRNIADTVYNRIYYDACPIVHIVYPGDEIPKWFNNATDDGNSINHIRLPLNLFKFDGSKALFAVCVVGVLNNFDDDDDDERMRRVSFKCTFNFKTNTSDDRVDKYVLIGGHATFFLQPNTNNADHVFIMHQRDFMCLDERVLEQVFGRHQWCFLRRNVDTLQASFSISLTEGVGANLDIKKCGIRFIHDNDNGEPNVDSTTGESSFDFDSDYDYDYDESTGESSFDFDFDFFYDYDYDESTVDSTSTSGECSYQASGYQDTDI